ncbi:unnamed protein product [Arctia plantaginis]|uniref:J domain-containing protein n=1 Tax=Arctia plantaginis TaxID=874455 RepID=A0A8S0YL86_ARCPL|nr:unnamed protein product [Arctia plantaginis]
MYDDGERHTRIPNTHVHTRRPGAAARRAPAVATRACCVSAPTRCSASTCTTTVSDTHAYLTPTYTRGALELQRDARLLCERADALLGLDMYDDAIQAFKEALEIDEGLQRAKDGLNRAQKLQKQSEQRDYYKILGVKRSASKQEITKAYRKAAQKWHPDNFQGDEKKVAEKKFIDIAAAKEVLTDPEKRAQFDAGNDPLDPEAQRGGQGGPFHNPFHHFQHGSPFQFKFHFN